MRSRWRDGSVEPAIAVPQCPPSRCCCARCSASAIAASRITLAHIAPLEQEDQRLYAVVDVDMKPYVFNFGVGYGFTRQADAWTIKAIIEVPTEEILKH